MSVQSIGQKLFEGLVSVLSEAGYVGSFSKEAEDSSVWSWYARDRKVELEIDEKKGEFVLNISNPTDGDNTLRKRNLGGNKVVFELDARASTTTPSEKVFLQDLKQQLGLRVNYFALYPNGQKSKCFFTKVVSLNQSHDQIVAGLQEDLARSICRLESAYYYEGGKKVVIFGN